MIDVRIDLAAFRHNLNAVKTLVGDRVAVLPVIKADAYGHGMVPLAKESLAAGARMLGVGVMEEAKALRREKIAAPALVMDGIFPEQAAEAVALRVTPALFSLETARELNRAAKQAGKKVPVHLKFDTGMSRLGFGMAECGEALAQIVKMKNLAVEGVMTHLASASDTQSPQTDHQLRRFDAILAAVNNAGIKPAFVHSANSGGVLNFKASHHNMVRPGIMLYGSPPGGAKGFEFRPVMRVTGRIVSVKEVPQGEGVGYNATYITPRKKRVGVVMGGYADGVNRLLSNRGAVEVSGKSVPVIGMVCMDGFMIDLSKAPGAKPGDEVVLLGGETPGTAAETWADICNTIPYEIYCRLGVGPRVNRSYK